MTTTLKPNPDLQFFEDLHRYWIPSKKTWVPYSVTKICSFDMSKEARVNIERTKDNWEPRGNAIHAALEAFLKGEETLESGDYADWIDPLVSHPLWEKYKPIAIEHRMVSRDGYYAGSLDCLLEGPDKDGNTITVLADLKTLSSARSKTRSIARQAGGYISMLNDQGVHVDKVLGIFAKPNGTELRVEDPADCLVKWCDALDCFKALRPDF